MRGLGEGQTIHLLTVEEVANLVHDVASSGNLLTDILAWLVVSALRWENIQNARLRELHLMTVVRKSAFTTLMENSLQPRAGSGSVYGSIAWLEKCAALFLERLDYSVADPIVEVVNELTRLRDLADCHQDFVLQPSQSLEISTILEGVMYSSSSKAAVEGDELDVMARYDVEVANEVEQEQEQEQQHPPPKVPVRAFSGQPRLSEPWSLLELSGPGTLAGGAGWATSIRECEQDALTRSGVESASSFKPMKDAAFPGALLLSRNLQGGEVQAGMRLKNVEMALSWRTSDAEGEHRTVALSLDEAQTLRFVLAHHDVRQWWGASLRDVAMVHVRQGGAINRFSATRDLPTLKPSADVRAFHLPLLRFYNSDLVFSATEIETMAVVLAGGCFV